VSETDTLVLEGRGVQEVILAWELVGVQAGADVQRVSACDTLAVAFVLACNALRRM